MKGGPVTENMIDYYVATKNNIVEFCYKRKIFMIHCFLKGLQKDCKDQNMSFFAKRNMYAYLVKEKEWQY